MKFTHKEVEIDLAVNGQFTARVNGVFVSKPSLAAMRKHIDDARRAAFAPFAAMTLPSWRESADGDGVVKVEIVGVEKGGRYSHFGRQAYYFLAKHKGGQIERNTSVMTDTPENRAALRALAEHRAESKRLARQRDEEEKKLAAAVVYLHAEHFKAPTK